MEGGSRDTLDIMIHFSFLPGDRDTLKHTVMDRAEIGTTRRAGMRNVLWASDSSTIQYSRAPDFFSRVQLV